MNPILFLSRWLPYPPNNGSKIRIYNLIRGLHQHYKISLVTFIDPSERDWDLGPLKQLCSEVVTVPWKAYQPSSIKSLVGAFNVKPRYLKDTFSLEMKKEIEHMVTSKKFVFVVASQVDTAVYREYCGNLPAIFEEVELASIYERFANAKGLRNRPRFFATWVKHRRFLANLLKLFDACTVVSEQEKQILMEAVPGYDSVKIIPNCIDIESYGETDRPPKVPNQLIFTGSFTYRANYDAMVWFTREILPIVRNEVPDTTLIITGDHSNLFLPELSNVKLTGLVEDVRPSIAESSVSIAPIMEGGGSRLKILEAMALNTPVVATSKGAEGLEVEHMKHLLISDSVKGFADAIIRLLRNHELREELTDNAFQLVSSRYNWSVIFPQVFAITELVAQEHKDFYR